MTVDQTIGHRGLAAAARSILSCPADVQLVVDGVDDISGGLDAEAPGSVPVLRMQEVDGHAVFSCPTDAVLAHAAAEGRGAVLTVDSGLGAPDSPGRSAVLTIAGTLGSDVGRCDCCTDLRARVSLRPDLVRLSRRDRPDEHLRVPLAEYRAPGLHLNRGFLQRSAEHANEHHQAELRHAVAAAAGIPASGIAGVGLTDLRPDRVDVSWVDHTGAHREVLAFARTARTTYELGELLREELHAGLC